MNILVLIAIFLYLIPLIITLLLSGDEETQEEEDKYFICSFIPIINIISSIQLWRKLHAKP